MIPRCPCPHTTLRVALVCFPLVLAASIVSGQRHAGSHSGELALAAHERLGPNPLRPYADGVALYTYLDVEGREHLRIRRLDGGLDLVFERVVAPAPNYRALEWLSVAGGRVVVAVLTPCSLATRGALPLLVEGYGVADGRRLFSHAIEDFAGDPAAIEVLSAGSAGGEHAAVAVVSPATPHRRALTVLTLDRVGELAGVSRDHDLSLGGHPVQTARLYVDDAGAAHIAIASSGELAVIRVNEPDDRLIQHRVALPRGHHAIAFDWLPGGSPADGPGPAKLIGLAERRGFSRAQPKSFAVTLPTETAAAARSLPADVHALALPRMWRRLSSRKLHYAAPQAVGHHGVAFAVQAIEARTAGHPKATYRQGQLVVGDILVAVVDEGGQLVHHETVTREIRVPTRSAAAAQITGLRLVHGDAGLGLFYADRAGGFLGGPARAGAPGVPADLTIYHPIGGAGPDDRGWIVHDDRSEFVGLPASGTEVGPEATAFVAVASTATTTGDGEGEPARRVRVVIAGDRLRSGR